MCNCAVISDREHGRKRNEWFISTKKYDKEKNEKEK
jgi:hypothetical protein